MYLGMWLGFYIIPSILCVALMVWYAFIFGPKQDKEMEARRERLIKEREAREKGAEN